MHNYVSTSHRLSNSPYGCVKSETTNQVSSDHIACINPNTLLVVIGFSAVR